MRSTGRCEEEVDATCLISEWGEKRRTRMTEGIRSKCKGEPR